MSTCATFVDGQLEAEARCLFSDRPENTDLVEDEVVYLHPVKFRKILVSGFR